MNINSSPSKPSGHMHILLLLKLKQAALFLQGLSRPKHCKILEIVVLVVVAVVDVVVVVDVEIGTISSLGIVPK
jgi:hypothetical protein